MPGEKVNWEAVETWQRVLAAIIATGVKIDLKTAATMYGTTYDTLENKFRKIKKMAIEMKAEVDSGERGEVVRVKSAPNTPRKPKTPTTKTALGTVANGRVTKSTPSSSRKKNMKQEPFEETSASSFLDSSFDMDFAALSENASFNYPSPLEGFPPSMDYSDI